MFSVARTMKAVHATQSNTMTLYHMGRVKRKRVFEHAQNAYSDHPGHVRSIIRAFALHSYIL